MKSPQSVYQALLKGGSIKADDLQKQVVTAFESLYQEISKTPKSWFFKPKKKFHGLYIHGSVGRGKTFLMDLFVNCVDAGKIRRLHFHNFMLWLHQELRKIKKQQDPIDLIIQKLAKDIQILCLDEFLVHDITDAMLLSTLLFALEKYGVSLITTSNVNPINLYEGGLQRKKFIPAIEWMQEKMQILQLDGDYDYRTHTVATHKKWFYPISLENQDDFEHLFSELTAHEELEFSPITINKRRLEVVKRSKKHIMFESKILCEQPRNANDFIQLGKQYHSIFMHITDPIANEDRNTARRFITLVDVLYDAGIPLYVLSPVNYDKIYQGDELAFEMQRTVSRLTEMQQ